MEKSNQVIKNGLITNEFLSNEVHHQSKKSFHKVRVFYAVFFGIAALAFAFQPPVIDTIDWAFISACMGFSFISFLLSVKR